MKSYRRIEINAFRRRVKITSNEQASDESSGSSDTVVQMHDPQSLEEIDTDSDQGQRILEESIEILQARLVPNKTAI